MPVSWQIAPSVSTARSMFCAMIVSACDDRVPPGSAPSAVFIAARTSGGKSVDVRTMSCRTLSKKLGSISLTILVGRVLWTRRRRQLRRCRVRKDPTYTVEYRLERDSLGEIRVPADAYYGVQTMRAAENFPISGLRAPADLVEATVRIKRAAAQTNASLGRLDADVADAIVAASDEILAGALRDQFI